VPAVPTSLAARSVSNAVAFAVTVMTLVALAPPAAAAPYSAPLRTAVRQLVVAAENNAGYDRDAQFSNGWADADGDCQDTRHEVLIAESTVTPTLSSSGCTVTAGRWTTFYDDATYTSPTQVQIDHMVPVAEAWGSGAQAWTAHPAGRCLPERDDRRRHRHRQRRHAGARPDGARRPADQWAGGASRA
jgi:hypothetical protein